VYPAASNDPACPGGGHRRPGAQHSVLALTQEDPMPSGFSGSPKFLKGALVVFETIVPVPTNLIVFQYNPETMSRSFEQRGIDFELGRNSGDTFHVQFPPVESFQVTVELDSADQLEN